LACGLILTPDLSRGVRGNKNTIKPRPNLENNLVLFYEAEPLFRINSSKLFIVRAG